jgi:hypothetical protein
VHLAGALAKPVWTLVAIPSDWRWLEDRDDSPWYPTMRLFRQRDPGEWNDVIGQLKTALEQEVDRDSHRDESGTTVRASFPLAVARPALIHSGSAAAGDLCRVAETRVGIMMYAPSDTLTGRSIELYGECMHVHFELLARFVTPGMTVLEAGAGIGAHSVPLAAALGTEGHLFLYEDDGFLKQLLHENVRSNGITNATIMRRSLAREVPDDRGDAATGSRPPANGDAEAAEPKAETIDELRLEHLDWLKISERVDAPFIIEGATETLRRLRPGLFVAAPDGASLQCIASVVKEYGYACWQAAAPLFNPENFNGRDADVFAGRECVALLAVPAESARDIAIEGCEKIV